MSPACIGFVTSTMLWNRFTKARDITGPKFNVGGVHAQGTNNGRYRVDDFVHQLELRAQTPAQELTAVPPKLNLTPEQRYIIKEIIKDMTIERVSAKVLTVGDQTPHNIRLQPIPSDVAQKAPQIKTHKFFVAGKQIIIVDPRDNKVAEIINLGSD
jgi:hypothetical protein